MAGMMVIINGVTHFVRKVSAFGDERARLRVSETVNPALALEQLLLVVINAHQHNHAPTLVSPTLVAVIAGCSIY